MRQKYASAFMIVIVIVIVGYARGKGEGMPNHVLTSAVEQRNKARQQYTKTKETLPNRPRSNGVGAAVNLGSECNY